MLLHRRNDDDHIMAISDLMSGLMIVFLLVAISYMQNVSQSKKRITDIVVTYNNTQVSLYENLMEEFKEDLPRWGASIDQQTLSISFFEPEILFKSGEAAITPRFKEILKEFFPRYISILFSDKFKDSIAEIRIEGHTSSEWASSQTNADDAYFYNMELSQQRTLSVLRYCTGLINDSETRKYIRRFITANGLSSSKLVYTEDGKEDKARSRRVEFRTRTNAERKIVQILEEIEHD